MGCCGGHRHGRMNHVAPGHRTAGHEQGRSRAGTHGECCHGYGAAREAGRLWTWLGAGLLLVVGLLLALGEF